MASAPEFDRCGGFPHEFFRLYSVKDMAYQQVREILQSVRQFHRRLRLAAENEYGDNNDPRSQFLLKSLSRSEQEMGHALKEYENEGNRAVLETWIQYIPDDDLQATILGENPPPGASPLEILEWRREIDVALGEIYRQLARQVSAPRAAELFESLAGLPEQRLADHVWQGRDEKSIAYAVRNAVMKAGETVKNPRWSEVS